MAAHSTSLSSELPVRPVQKSGRCTCKADIERTLLDAFKETAPAATRHEVELQGYGLRVVDNELIVQPFMKFKFSADHPMRTGAARHRVKVGVMHFTYCPFCGQNLKEGR